MKQDLIHMRDKLNNINKRNRSIRLLKLYDKWSYDLSKTKGLNVEDIVDGMKKSNRQFSLMTKDNDDDAIITRKLTSLYRNMKSIEDETGVYDFYLGSPFITGTFSDGTFFQAPLFLYPARLEKAAINKQEFVIKKGEGVPIINRTLFLAFKKIDQLHVSEEWMEKGSTEAFNDDNSIVSYLSEVNIKVAYNNEQYESLKEYTQETVPEKSSFKLLKNAVIGHYPQGSSSIVRDYDQLIQLSDTDNLALVGEMLNPQDKFIGESDWDEKEKVANDIREYDRLYLLDTDGSQEEILNQAHYKPGLAVHGPPGTGKSQVIVNLITDALHHKKKVLLVCQKRAALDVVYQRLQGLELTNNTALIHDENHDRKDLYTKINNTLSWHANVDSNSKMKLRTASLKLEEQEAILDSIAIALHTKNEFGLSLYELYSKAQKTDDSFVYIDIHEIASKLEVPEMENILSEVYTYAEWYERFGQESYPLKYRFSFANFGMKDKADFINKMNYIITQMKEAEKYLSSLDDKDITPAYTWEIQTELKKINPDLIDGKGRTLNSLRIWVWTSFTGKQIIERLTGGEKFAGTKSAEWLKLKKSLMIMYEIAQITDRIKCEIEKLSIFLQQSIIEKYLSMTAEGDLPLNDFEKILQHLHSDFEELQHMDQSGEEFGERTQKVIKLLISKTNQMNYKNLPDKWVETMRESVYLAWIDIAELKFPVVKKVSSSEYDRIRESFEILVGEKKELARKHLISELNAGLSSAQEINKTSIKEIKHQSGKKRLVWPVRKLVNEFADKGLMDVVPVWLASPEIVSSIFPLKKDLFDLVIFDEASQCSVESGLPSVYRARQVIIAGDEMQLPPSNLFKASIDGDDDGDGNGFIAEDSASLLNLAKRRFDEKTLQWHYRSKFEELINFSNHAFYNGAIQISPNVQPYKEPPAMRWIKVDNGRWINKSNEVEAYKVVSMIKALLKKKQEKSIGIITFNSTQQSKIQDILEQEISRDSEFGAMYSVVMSKDMDERIFVKNIENVQGDERDIIIFSVGYGKNEEGRVYNRFGTLNQDGGENRLNVAVTRAKEEIIVVSSIEPEELEVGTSKGNGPSLFRDYLKYVKAVSNGHLEQVKEVILEVNKMSSTRVSSHSLDFDSPFEEQVYKGLRDLGYDVHTQVGMSGYRIDLAVVHPNDASNYIIGIECDGAMYHSSKNAKERDIYRQKFLESRGWTIARIWSRNWWRNPTTEIEKIDHAIRKLIKHDQVKEKIINNTKKGNENYEISPPNQVVEQYNESQKLKKTKLKSKLSADKKREQIEPLEKNDLKNLFHIEEENSIEKNYTNPDISVSEEYLYYKHLLRKESFEVLQDQPLTNKLYVVGSESLRKELEYLAPKNNSFTFHKSGLKISDGIPVWSIEFEENKAENTIESKNINKTEKSDIQQKNRQLDIFISSNEEKLLSYLDECKIEYVDNRSKGGALWLIGEESLEIDLEPLKKFEMYFRYKPNGSRSSKYKPAWYYLENNSDKN